MTRKDLFEGAKKHDESLVACESAERISRGSFGFLRSDLSSLYPLIPKDDSLSVGITGTALVEENKRTSRRLPKKRHRSICTIIGFIEEPDSALAINRAEKSAQIQSIG
jgi:hypothetical protein